MPSASITGSVRNRWVRRLLVALVLLAVVVTVVLGMRVWGTFTLLRSAYEAGAAQTSSVRPWMTLRYVAAAYRAPAAALREQLGLAPDTDPDTTLFVLATRAGVSPPEYVRRVQLAIAAVASLPLDSSGAMQGDLLGTAGDAFVSAVLAYGYAALALSLMLGALGVPLPSGLSMVVAGSLAAQGQMRWEVLAVLATAASVAGDLGGYALGRILGESFIEGRGRWFGLTADRRARAERLFERWGAFGVLLSRSLVSLLSPAVNLIAGVSRYRFGAFVAFAVLGRLLWSSAYLGLGYFAGGGLEPAADFLASLTGLLVSVALLVALCIAIRRSDARTAASESSA
ncbi:MAG: DedA family protein [Burkholderiaceae bacterium]|nr:DedA family protein [Burkholderiaceae bacterium]